MAFKLEDFRDSPYVHIEYVQYGQGRIASHIEHIQEPLTAAVVGVSNPNNDPSVLAAAYVEAVAPLYGIKDPPKTGMLSGLSQSLDPTMDKDLDLSKLQLPPNPLLSQKQDNRLRQAKAPKTLNGTTVVTYVQTNSDLPIWKAGLAVVITEQGGELRVTSSHGSVHPDAEVLRPAIAERPNQPGLTSMLLGEVSSPAGGPPSLLEGIQDSLLAADQLDKKTLEEFLRTNASMRSLGLSETTQDVIQDEKVDEKVRVRRRITRKHLVNSLGLDSTYGTPKIKYTRLLNYRYDPRKREERPTTAQRREFCMGGHPVLPLLKVDQPISSAFDRHYVVREFIFSLDMPNCGSLEWRAFLELGTGLVLYIRPFVSLCTASVYLTDPVTATGKREITANAPIGELNKVRELVELNLNLDKDTPGVATLVGKHVKAQDADPPVLPAPALPAPSADFTYTAPTGNFAAVNAFYHLESLFETMIDLGFKRGEYFDGTKFPIAINQQFFGVDTTAMAKGDGRNDGVQSFSFGSVALGNPLGNAADRRIVTHEFCHALMYDTIHSPNFGFAHSAGDALGAILCDPGSKVPDPESDSMAPARKEPGRYETFPWLGYGRRHDRRVEEGWAWYGEIYNSDNGAGQGYKREQILATSLFRIYQALGGGYANLSTDERRERQYFAARYMMYLIIKAISILPVKSICPTDVQGFVTALREADLLSPDFDTRTKSFRPIGREDKGDVLPFGGKAGGASHKVIRWGFEQQGLYPSQRVPTPITVAATPEVDVYIDDGRHGEYKPYQERFWETQDIWNRTEADGGVTHERPVGGKPSFTYVRIKNRGSRPASGIEVKAYSCPPSAGLVWEVDAAGNPLPPLQPLPAPQMDLSTRQVAPRGETIVGPFVWTPQKRDDCLLMSVSASGDLSNIDPNSHLQCAQGPIPLWRLIPLDNNVALRNLVHVSGKDRDSLTADFNSLGRSGFEVCNPYNRQVDVRIEAILPDFLRKCGWIISFRNDRADSFRLDPKSSSSVTFSLVPSLESFQDADVIKEKAEGRSVAIVMQALINGIVVGGMTYVLDPTI